MAMAFPMGTRSTVITLTSKSAVPSVGLQPKPMPKAVAVILLLSRVPRSSPRYMPLSVETLGLVAPIPNRKEPGSGLQARLGVMLIGVVGNRIMPTMKTFFTLVAQRTLGTIYLILHQAYLDTYLSGFFPPQTHFNPIPTATAWKMPLRFLKAAIPTTSNLRVGLPSVLAIGLFSPAIPR